MWKNLIESYSNNPRDVKSVPLRKKTELWFYVYVENGKLYVERARNHSNSSNLSMRRMLSSGAEKCNIMYDIYLRRKAGAAVANESMHITVNSIYWYGIFADMEL